MDTKEEQKLKRELDKLSLLSNTWLKNVINGSKEVRINELLLL